MTQKQIDKQVQVIKDHSARLVKAGKWACLRFLLDAGIIDWIIIEDYDGLGL